MLNLRTFDPTTRKSGPWEKENGGRTGGRGLNGPVAHLANFILTHVEGREERWIRPIDASIPSGLTSRQYG